MCVCGDAPVRVCLHVCVCVYVCARVYVVVWVDVWLCGFDRAG